MKDGRFEVGDVACLRSGGPNMTVSRVNNTSGGSAVACVWHSDGGDVRQAEFLALMLEEVKG